MSTNDPIHDSSPIDPLLARRTVLGGALAAGAAAFACGTSPARASQQAPPAKGGKARKDYPVLVGSQNALAGMKLHYAKLQEGADPLDVAIEVVKVVEADPNDDSVGLGGLPNEEGVVQLDAACMYGPRHKSGAVACIENILHPSEVARLVLERTDHCLLVGKDAYRFARAFGHEHVELLTEPSRQKWLEWKASTKPEHHNWLPAPKRIPWTGSAERPVRDAQVAAASEYMRRRQWGTIHVSAM